VIAPTTSPRLFRTATSRHSSIPSKKASAGRSARELPSSTFNVHATPSPAAQSSPSAPRFAYQPGFARIRSVSSAPAPPTSSGRVRIASAIRPGTRTKRSAIRERGIANVGTPQPSTAVEDSPTSCETRCCSGWSSERYGWSGHPCARHAASIPACLPEQLCPSLPSGRPSCSPFSRSSTDAPARVSSFRTAASCAGSAWCDAQAIASSSSPRSSYASASGIAWTGFSDERRKQWTSSPTASPSVDRACTWCTASTTSPRSTVTLIASTDAGAYVARTARGRSLAPPARPARQEIADREGRSGAHRDPEDVRPAARRPRRRGLPRRRTAREEVPPADRRRRARPDGSPDERRPPALRALRRQGCEDARPAHPVCRRRRAAAHRGRLQEAGRRLAAAARGRGGGARAPRAGGRHADDGGARRHPRRRVAAAPLAAPRPAPDRGYRPRVGERDPLGGAALALRALDAARRRGDRAARRDDPRRDGPRPRAAPRRRERREDLPRARPSRAAVRALRHAARTGRLRGAHDLLLPHVPDRGPGAEGPAALEAPQVRPAVLLLAAAALFAGCGSKKPDAYARSNACPSTLARPRRRRRRRAPRARSSAPATGPCRRERPRTPSSPSTSGG